MQLINEALHWHNLGIATIPIKLGIDLAAMLALMAASAILIYT